MRKVKNTVQLGNPGVDNQSDEIDKRLALAASGRLTESEREKLWNAINTEDETEAIRHLVDSYEFEILTTIRQLSCSDLSLEEMLEAGKSSLAKMLSQTPANLRKVQFEKFGLWWVKQGVLECIR